MKRRRRAAIAAIGFAITIGASSVISSPGQAASQSDATPQPVECTVAPLPMPIWDGVEIAEPTAPVSIAGPFVPPTGEPVDDATRSAVRSTIAESIACQNAGDLARTLALFTPDAVRVFFSGPRGFDPNAVEATIAAGPVPAETDRVVELSVIADVVLLGDGRVGATVTTAVGAQTYVDFLFLAQGGTPDGGSRWLIDGSVAIDSQTQVQGGATEIP